jgi:hypothetical protein
MACNAGGVEECKEQVQRRWQDLGVRVDEVVFSVACLVFGSLHLTRRGCGWMLCTWEIPWIL